MDLPQCGSEPGTCVPAFQGYGHDGFEVAEFVAGIEAAASEDHAMHTGALTLGDCQGLQGIRELDFPSTPWRGLLEDTKDAGVQDIAPDDGKVRGFSTRPRILRDPSTSMEATSAQPYALICSGSTSIKATTEPQATVTVG